MPDYAWVYWNMLDYARIYMNMPKSAWTAFVSHVPIVIPGLLGYVFSYFNEVYIESEGAWGCFLEEKKLGFRPSKI